MKATKGMRPFGRSLVGAHGGHDGTVKRKHAARRRRVLTRVRRLGRLLRGELAERSMETSFELLTERLLLDWTRGQNF